LEPFLGNYLGLVFRELNEVHNCSDNAECVGDEPAFGPAGHDPFEVHVVQETNFGKDYQMVEKPEEKESDSWDESQNEFVKLLLVHFAEHCIDFLVLQQ
jgi:hypothetical protein